MVNTAIDVVNVLTKPVGHRAFNVSSKIIKSDNDNDNDEDGDIVMDDNKEKEEKEMMIPDHDGLDIYDCNSSLLLSLEMDKTKNSLDLREEIIKSNNLNLSTKFDQDTDPTCMRISILQKKWKIMKDEEKFNQKKGKMVVEFLSEPGKPKKNNTVLFVYKLIPNNNNSNKYAMYGSKYEVTCTVAQKTKLNNLKSRIIAICQWKATMKNEDMILAVRNIESHEWKILKEKESKIKNNKYPQRRNKKPRIEKLIDHKLHDRDIIAVLDTKSFGGNVNFDEIPITIFETEWDKYCQELYKNRPQRESSTDSERPLILHFGDDENKNDNDNDDDDNDDE